MGLNGTKISCTFLLAFSSYSTLILFLPTSRIYVDTKLHHMLDLKFDKSFFDLGDFPPVVQNATDILALENPWVNGTKAAPFDQCATFLTCSNSLTVILSI